jgi:hypothetical protein
MSIPHDQSADHHYLGQAARKAKSAKLSAAPTSPYQHQGDRGSCDHPGLSRLPYYVRFRNLREAGIVDSWEQLSQLIDRYGFPSGTANIRVWDINDVRQWLANRPTERKGIVAPYRNKEAENAGPLRNGDRPSISLSPVTEEHLRHDDT